MCVSQPADARDIFDTTQPVRLRDSGARDSGGAFRRDSHAPSRNLRFVCHVLRANRQRHTDTADTVLTHPLVPESPSAGRLAEKKPSRPPAPLLQEATTGPRQSAGVASGEKGRGVLQAVTSAPRVMPTVRSPSLEPATPQQQYRRRALLRGLRQSVGSTILPPLRSGTGEGA